MGLQNVKKANLTTILKKYHEKGYHENYRIMTEIRSTFYHTVSHLKKVREKGVQYITNL